MAKILASIALTALAAMLAGCATKGTPAKPAEPAAVSSGHGVYKVGNPYQVSGVWYYPREQPDYDETGIASWYGTEFHGRLTANGEVFDRNAVTAAHTTLPLPVNARVTNLENGRSIVVRINDRGPYVNGRVIDLSEHAADLLGYRTKGTARVRVTFLGRADLNGNGYAPTSEYTPPEIATAVPAAPTESVTAAPLEPVPGVAEAPAPVEQPQAPVPGPEVASLPEPEPDGEVTVVAVPPVTSIYVQAGAYASRDNAARVVMRLQSLGAKIAQGVKDGRPIYRVRIGPFQDVDQADQTLMNVFGLGHNDASIVVE